MTNATTALSLTEMASPLSFFANDNHALCVKIRATNKFIFDASTSFYMMKARTLARLGVTDESKLLYLKACVCRAYRYS